MSSRILFLDLGPFGGLMGNHSRNGIDGFWQDHGVGLLRTILHANGIQTELASTRLCTSWEQVCALLAGYDMLLMNVRSYRYPQAVQCAKYFKQINGEEAKVLVGGMHATVSPDDMERVEEFDHICKGPGENTIIPLVQDPDSFPKIFNGEPSKRMEDWPRMDRTLWPKAVPPDRQAKYFPLEADCGWGDSPTATMITSRVCPWRCSFCNEHSYIAQMERRSVDSVIDELNWLDETHGPLGSVVFHDSMFFQNPPWIKEFIEKYPKKANKPWEYWAAARADTVRKWPDLFEALVMETNWTTVSIGFESGSTRALEILNKECTAEDNAFTIDLLNRLGDRLVDMGRTRPRFWANIMLGIPGETREDAFKTIKMYHAMKEPILTLAYYSPFAGSALGNQLIAEGKALHPEAHERYAGQPKVAGVDYQFYADLQAGKYNDEVRATSWP